MHYPANKNFHNRVSNFLFISLIVKKFLDAFKIFKIKPKYATHLKVSEVA